MNHKRAERQTKGRAAGGEDDVETDDDIPVILETNSQYQKADAEMAEVCVEAMMRQRTNIRWFFRWQQESVYRALVCGSS